MCVPWTRSSSSLVERSYKSQRARKVWTNTRPSQTTMCGASCVLHLQLLNCQCNACVGGSALWLGPRSALHLFSGTSLAPRRLSTSTVPSMIGHMLGCDSWVKTFDSWLHGTAVVSCVRLLTGRSCCSLMQTSVKPSCNKIRHNSGRGTWESRSPLQVCRFRLLRLQERMPPMRLLHVMRCSLMASRAMPPSPLTVLSQCIWLTANNMNKGALWQHCSPSVNSAAHAGLPWPLCEWRATICMIAPDEGTVAGRQAALQCIKYTRACLASVQSVMFRSDCWVRLKHTWHRACPLRSGDRASTTTSSAVADQWAAHLRPQLEGEKPAKTRAVASNKSDLE